jgi:hypothetical protein
MRRRRHGSRTGRRPARRPADDPSRREPPQAMTFGRMHTSSTDPTPRDGGLPQGRGAAPRNVPCGARSRWSRARPDATAPAQRDEPVEPRREVAVPPGPPAAIARGYLPPFDGARRDAGRVRQVLSDLSVRASWPPSACSRTRTRGRLRRWPRPPGPLHESLGEGAAGGACFAAAPGWRGGPAGKSGCRRDCPRRPDGAVAHDPRARRSRRGAGRGDLCRWVLGHCKL